MPTLQAFEDRSILRVLYRGRGPRNFFGAGNPLFFLGGLGFGF